MPAKKPVRKPATKAPSVPKALRVEVFVSRGDASLKAETTAGDALAVARFLIAVVRQLAAEAPDMLPHIEHVPGDVLPYDWAEEYADGTAAKITPVKRVGFR